MIDRKKTILFLFVLVVVFSFSCSTKKNTFTRRVYHNLTAHYNAYFNGKEALKEGKNELAKKNKDNFQKILPVFELGTKADAQTQYHLFDRAIEKGSIVIQRHSIYIKGVEHIRWIDDAYMLIGKSYFYKQEYDLAMQTFNFVLNRFKNNSIKYEAIIWKSMVLTCQDRLDDAQALLASIENKIEKNKATRAAEKLFPLAYADVLLKQGHYDQAIDYLKQAYDLNKSKHVRTRLNFILAQTYQKLGQHNKSNEHFKKVISQNPVYDMEFAAKMNLARNYDVVSGSSKDIRKLLTKMLRDDKNKDFLDQIYYVIAEIDLKENKIEDAIEHLKKSARSSVSNDFQKALSYLKLADLYFSQPQYKEAQVYYDSCVVFLPKDFPNYTLIENKKNTLNELVRNINIVELQDSLQRLAKMPVNERNQKIDQIINEIIKEEERKKQEEIERMQNIALAQQNQSQNMQNTGSWYFYNPSAMSFGYTEFVRKWGNRKYEDLWRLSNKAVTEVTFNEIEEEGDNNNGKDTVKVNLKDRNYYISKLPLTPEAIEASDLAIAEALYNIGYIYKEALLDNDKAIEAFSKLEKRYPDSKFILPAYYNLYQLHKLQGNTSKAEYYKNLILSKFPDSDYAQIILDPNYYLKMEEKQNENERQYKEAYIAYTNGNYDLVITLADKFISTQKDKKIIPKFELLRALAIGKTQTTESFEAALTAIVTKYGGTDQAKRAQEILNAIQKKKNPEPQKTQDTVVQQPVSKDLYKYDPAAFHFYVAVLDVKNIKINEVKIAYSNFHLKTFSTKKYTINTLFLDDKREVLSVSRFENKNDAMDYLMAVENNQEIMSQIQKANYRHFVISAANYPVFYQNKDVDKYLEFFNKYYKKP